MEKESYPDDFSPYEIGGNYQALLVNNAKGNSAAALSLIQQSRYKIDIFTHNLDPHILDKAEIADAISKFIRISPKSRLRILLADPALAIKQGHRLIELSRKFSSFIAIRQINQDFINTPYCFLMVDDKALIYRPHASQYQGFVNYNARLECRQHQEFFDDVWECSEPASELRQLFI